MTERAAHSSPTPPTVLADGAADVPSGQSSPATVTAHAFSEAMAAVTECVQRFVTAWRESATAPDLVRFLPDKAPDRVLALAELVKVDLEFRWQQRNLPKSLDAYLAEFSEWTDRTIPADVIYKEYRLRKQHDASLDPDEYIRRFPDQMSELRGLMGMTQTFSTTSLVTRPPKDVLDSLQPGRKLDDFDLLVELGRGAFARVFLARQQSMQRLVALKISTDSGDEPQTLAQFDHEHIVRVYDQRTESQQGLRLLYMQYLPGGTLQSVVEAVRRTPVAERSGRLLLATVRQNLDARGEPLPSESSVVAALAAMTWPEAVCWIGSRLALALDAAHHAGTLHRDVKPANVLLTAEGSPKLADFNVSFCAKVTGATPAAYFGGSLAYMSPEQLDACNPAQDRSPESLDGRSDLYSLGVLLWELLTGARPFADESGSGGWFTLLTSLALQRRRGLTDVMLNQLPSDVPLGLVDVLRRCLAPEPSARWPSGAEMARQLELCRHRELQGLLHPAAASSPVRLLPLTVPLVVFLAAAANVPAGAFNFAYNHVEIIQRLSESSQLAFMQIQGVINAVAFPIGLSLVGWAAHRVMRVLRRLQRGDAVSEPELRQARARCLLLGHHAALIGVVAWALAGVAYPVSIDYVGGDLPASAHAHFFGSLLLCGMIAAAYPYFGVTCLGLLVIYPRLLAANINAVHDAPRLAQLRRQSWIYLALAVLVPLLSVLALAVIGSKAQFALVVLSATAIVGFGVLLRCFSIIQRTLQVLDDALTLHSTK